MEDIKNKRIRTANYSLEEKSVLLQLVRQYKDIIENKKTDGCTNSEKENTWKLISDKFNSVAPNNVHRDINSLKKAYLNTKKNVRKDVAKQRLSMLKTGGGPADTKTNDSLLDITLDTINKKTVFGLPNQFDSDISMPECNIPHEDYENETSSGVVEEIIYIENDMEDLAENQYNNWSKWIPQKLANPLNDKLKEKLEMVPEQKSAEGNLETTKKSRRRPGAVALHSSEISKKYTELCSERLEIAKIEKCILEKKMKYDEEKHEIEMKIMKVELDIKEKQLNKM